MNFVLLLGYNEQIRRENDYLVIVTTFDRHAYGIYGKFKNNIDFILIAVQIQYLDHDFLRWQNSLMSYDYLQKINIKDNHYFLSGNINLAFYQD